MLVIPLVAVTIRLEVGQLILGKDFDLLTEELAIYSTLQMDLKILGFITKLLQMDSIIQMGQLRKDSEDHLHYLVVVVAIDFRPH